MDSSSVFPEEHNHPSLEDQRHQSYKQLIIQIADSLSQEDKEKIIYIHDLPDKMKQQSALDVLKWLHQIKGSKFKEWNVDQLKVLLQDINKEDLINNKVEPYNQEFCAKRGRPLSNSMPTGAMNPRVLPDKRSNSCTYHGQTRDLALVSENQEQSMAALNPTADVNQTDSFNHTQPVPQAHSSLSDTHMYTNHTPQLAPDEQERLLYNQRHMSERYQSFVQPFHSVHIGMQYPESIERSHSLSHFDSQSHNDYHTPHHQGVTGCNVMSRPQSAAVLMPLHPHNGGIEYRERTRLQSSPCSPNAAEWPSSAESNLDHNSCFSSSDMLCPRKNSLPLRKPNYYFDTHQAYDRRMSQEHSQGSLHQYPPVYTHCNSRSPGLSSGEDHRHIPPPHNRSLWGSSAYSSDFQSPQSSSPYHASTAYLTGRAQPEMRSGVHDNGVESYIPFGEPEIPHSHLCSGTSHHTIANKSPAISQQKNEDIHLTAVQEGTPNEKSDPQLSCEDNLKDSQNSDKEQSITAEEEHSQIERVLSKKLRNRSNSFNHKKMKTKNKSHRLSLQFNQSSSTTSPISDQSTASPSSVQKHKEIKRYTLPPEQEESVSVTSNGSSSPSHRPSNFESPPKADRTPKPYGLSLLLRTKPLKPQQELEWKVNMHDMMKLIYNPKHIGKYLSCPTKIAVEGADSKIILQLRLHPFGMEEDKNRNVTFEVVIEQSKKHRLHSEAKLFIQLSAECDNTKLELCLPRDDVRDANLSYFLIKGFICHEKLKKSMQYISNKENATITIKTEIIVPKYM